MKCLFNYNMDNFKFNFFLQGQLGTITIDNFFFFYSKCYHALSVFLVLFLHLLLKHSAGIVLSFNDKFVVLTSYNKVTPITDL